MLHAPLSWGHSSGSWVKLVTGFCQCPENPWWDRVPPRQSVQDPGRVVLVTGIQEGRGVGRQGSAASRRHSSLLLLCEWEPQLLAWCGACGGPSADVGGQARTQRGHFCACFHGFVSRACVWELLSVTIAWALRAGAAPRQSCWQSEQRQQHRPRRASPPADCWAGPGSYWSHQRTCGGERGAEPQ